MAQHMPNISCDFENCGLFG